MNCPKCTASVLTEELADGVTIDRCPDCHGIWLDELELETLLEQNPRGLIREDRAFYSSPDAEGPRLNCPHCLNVPLIKLNSRIRPGTIIDSCQVCFGAWLDAGEFARLSRQDLLGRLRTLFGL